MSYYKPSSKTVLPPIRATKNEQLPSQSTFHPSTTFSKRRSSTPIALPPSTTNIAIRQLTSTLLALTLILASGLSIHDLTTLRHPSPSWLVQYVAAKHDTVHFPWNDPDPDEQVGLYTHYLIRATVALFVLAAAHAHLRLAAHRRAAPVTLRLSPTHWVMQWATAALHGVDGRDKYVLWGGAGLESHRWTVGYWHPEYFWPLVLVEVCMFALPLWEPTAGGLREGFYVGMCAFLNVVGWATARRPAVKGVEREESNLLDEVFYLGTGLLKIAWPLLEGRRRRRRGY